ncbi:DEAD/DEAH box helicase [Laspinema olomoucense]|uniref:DEAD/DEAH box helicase n=1 Tax=Laspinema olomoucense TaxID=3231600 RepID=UPI0021BB9DC7|nr:MULTISPECIES: DEAD/DEAH box helicase [unclassified Laspinema]MCT7973659.1 DEAD/DEAH box helicase [Laspinema sp. D3d]MCT7996254.1 DEAD/DEAH box helicase [Laspinema sp. D3c]
MTVDSLNSLYNTERIMEIIRDLDTAKLAKELEAPVDANIESASSTLRVAAIAAITDLAGDESLDSWLRQRGASTDDIEERAKQVFVQWNSYLNALVEVDQYPDIDDLTLFSFAGLLARRPNEVRDFLRRPTPRRWLDDLKSAIAGLPWLEQVRSYVSSAVLFVIRQESHADVQAAGETIRQLAELQRQVEAIWLEQQNNQQREALRLLSFYHVGQAVLRTSEFLLAGSVVTDGRSVSDFGAELRRLLVRAEEFLQTTSDWEGLLWLKSVGITLVELRESSIWVQAKGISERIDTLINELTKVGRDQPIFSLLPSQQDALRQSLLDPSRIAIILQMPTSAGKTLLAEFSIVQTFDAYRRRTRVVYVVPTRALATQVRRTLTEDLGPLGISVSAAGSAFEEDPYELQLLQDTDGVVVATPEKLDLMLRAHFDWFNDLRLVVIDEAHLLGNGDRGVRLELLLANIRRELPEARLLLLTPFMDNAKQIAAWLSQSRGQSISVHWRPAKIILGMAGFSGRTPNRKLTVEWTNPFGANPKPLSIPTSVSAKETSSNTDRIVFLAKRFSRLGTTLAMFSASPADAEKAASKFAEQQEVVDSEQLTPQLKVAIALARHEYGEDSRLAYCLERGVAFHHSALSPIMRYLIEDQMRAKTINFVAATSTLAQGMNFPVATVLVHSVHKPQGKGNFSSGEFWNIAGRAGRVGMVEKGLVIFSQKSHQEHLERYTRELTESLQSALLLVLDKLSPNESLKDLYRNHSELRPFIQYLAHSAANSSPESAMVNLEELLQQSLANQQVRSSVEARKLRDVSRRYLQELTGRNIGFLKIADSTGLGSFSFDQLYATLQDDSVLKSGPREILSRRENGLSHLIDALRSLPELDLAVGIGTGQMSVQAVAELVQGWIDGKQAHELAEVFSGNDDEVKIRQAAKYLYGTVSQTMSWGTHAYLRGWSMGQPQRNSETDPSDAMLAAYIQYGVRTPEAAVASLLGVPRPFAEAFSEEYRQKFGQLRPLDASQFKEFVESADEQRWNAVVERAEVESISSSDMRRVVRQMQGFVD